MESDQVDLKGVLLLAYGAPRTLEEVEPFLASVTGGRPLPTPVAAEFRRRYLHIGGRSPLPAIVDALARELERRLGSEGGRWQVAVGTLFWRPSIREAVEALAKRGVARAVAITLVPQYSAASVGRYLARLEEDVAAAGEPFALTAVRSWATHPLLVEAFAGNVRAALDALPSGGTDGVEVVFTAHSVPVAAVLDGDPYESELRATAEAVARRVGIASWRLAYQSAGRGGGVWLGPTVEEIVSELAADGCRRALVVPIHFLADNVEILYDLDVALRERAEALGLRLARSESLNVSPLLVAALADLARRPSQAVDRSGTTG